MRMRGGMIGYVWATSARRGNLGYRRKSLGGHCHSDRRSTRSIAVRLKMQAPKKPPQHSAEQNKMLTDCLFALRANWLSHVESQPAHQNDRKSDERVVTLTNREQQVAALAGQGLPNKEIARQLGLSEGTVKVHAHHIYQKFGVKTRAALICALSPR